MDRFNYHTHTTYSDGRHAAREYVEHALQSGLRVLGFSDHAPVPMAVDWAMPLHALSDYRREIAALQSEYAGKIELYCGLEIDYIPGKVSPRDGMFEDLRLDYAIGAVHYVDHFADGTPWGVDNSAGEFREGLAQIFANDVRAAVQRYYQLIREMITRTKPTIVAHLDRIKKHNQHEVFFDERESWYREEMRKTLACIAEHGTILEVNTKGLYRSQLAEPFPSRWALSMAREMGVPVHLASDAHYTTDVINGFPAAWQMLWDCGYRELTLLTDGAWQAVPFDRQGRPEAPASRTAAN